MLSGLFGAFVRDFRGVRGLRAGFGFAWHAQASRGLQGPPGAGFRSRFRGPPGASGGPPQASGASAPSQLRMLGLVVGFASFLGCQPCSCLADPEISAFPGCLGRPAQWPPSAPTADPEARNLVSHSKGEGPLGGAPAPAPADAAHALQTL